MEETRFESRDPWPIWLWLFTLFLNGSLSIAADAALGTRWGWLSFSAQLLLIIWAATSTPLTVTVNDERLVVGSASIERSYLGKVTVLSAKEMALMRGRDSNPMCWMALRFWVATGVRIELNDPADPTPYWLVSAKRATALAAALS
jgi:hypothetical protein